MTGQRGPTRSTRGLSPRDASSCETSSCETSSCETSSHGASQRTPCPGKGPGRLRTLLFRATLLGYPASFRRRYAEDLAATFAEAWMHETRDRGSAFRFWLRLVGDGAINGARTRVAHAADAAATSHAISERRRETMLASMLSGVVQDARLALRGLSRQRGSAFAVVLTLALGIGAATAIFTVVDAVLLRPLPFAEPDRIVELRRYMSHGGILDSFSADLTSGLLRDSDVFESQAAHARIDGVLTGEGEPLQLMVRASSPDLFTVLGRTPSIGRIYTDREAADDARVMVISDEFWSTLGRDRQILGRKVEFDGETYEVIGVMPRDFRFPTVYAAHAFIPLSSDFRAAGMDQTRLSLIARLPAGMDTVVATQRIGTTVTALLGDEAATTTWTTHASGLGTWRANPDGRRALWLVAGAVGLMLLIAIMNATNLLLARVSTRSREFAVRHSLGAPGSRLLQQLVTESLVLAMLAGGAAVLMAYGGVHVLMQFAPTELTDLAAHRVAIDTRVLWFAFATTVATGLLLGVLPALSAARTARHRIGLSLSKYHGTSRERHRVRSGLVVGQLALAMTLLAGAGLLVASFVRVMQVNAGVDLDRVVLLMISPNDRSYPTRESRQSFGALLEAQIAALPGVASIARADGLPPSASFSFGLQLQAEGDAEPRESPLLLPFAFVRPDYLPTLGTRLIEGRNFTADETPESNVAIIDRDFARYFWGAHPAIGRRFRIGPDEPWLTVVGVLDELMLGGPDNSRGEYALLRPAAADLSATFFAIRAQGDARTLIQPVRDAIRAVDPSQPVWVLSTARAAVADEVTQQRFFMVLMTVLGTVSLALAALGLYSLLAFVVNSRTRELGIRVALGAQAAGVVGMIVKYGLVLAAIGIVIGLAGALAGARLIESLLFDTSPRSPEALGGIAAVMAAVAVLACALPAARAARLDPMTVLRDE